MKLYALLLSHKQDDGKVTVIDSAFDLQNFGYFQRGQYVLSQDNRNDSFVFYYFE